MISFPLKDQKSQLKSWKYQFMSKSWFILTFSIYLEQIWYKINIFRFILIFLIQSGEDLIDFVAKIDLDSKNLDQKFDSNPIWLQINLIKKLKAITSPKLMLVVTPIRLESCGGLSEATKAV